MLSAEYERMFALENEHWWFVARRSLTLQLLERFGTAGGRLLDLGCGTGAVLQELTARGRAVGIDSSPLALSLSRQRGLQGLIRGDAQAMPFRSESFDAVVSLDLFEHLPSDRAGIAEAFRVLRPGGILVLAVPAMESLWGPHDVALMHHRRYSRAEIVVLLKASGFGIRRASYSLFFLYPLVRWVRLLERRRGGQPRSSLKPVPNRINRALIALQRFEAAILGRVDLPWGSSVVVVAERPARRALPGSK